jgi:3-oxoacyl-[acyl-carrier-protein] synthase II
MDRIAYIKGAAIISPQQTFGEQHIPTEIAEYSDRFRCIEPTYRDFLDPMASRRMSRIVKMGVCSALKCMRDTGVSMPDAIIAGTGLGCLEDTEKFIGSIISNEEKLLNPTPFIQSTHNTVAGAIALAIKCHNYNATYTHRGFSFESALEDALLQLEETPGLNILAGGFDELTNNSYTITRRLGLWKNQPLDSSLLLQNKTRGSLPGEGVAFFMVSGEKGNNDLAVLKSLRTFFKPERVDDMKEHIQHVLHDSGLSINDIDLVMLGVNGDARMDTFYEPLTKGLFETVPQCSYKNLCGEYDTSSSFALWLASMILKTQQVPAAIRLNNPSGKPVNRILLYNHLRGINHAVYLIERC